MRKAPLWGLVVSHVNKRAVRHSPLYYRFQYGLATATIRIAPNGATEYRVVLYIVTPDGYQLAIFNDHITVLDIRNVGFRYFVNHLSISYLGQPNAAPLK